MADGNVLRMHERRLIYHKQTSSEESLPALIWFFFCVVVFSSDVARLRRKVCYLNIPFGFFVVYQWLVATANRLKLNRQLIKPLYV